MSNAEYVKKDKQDVKVIDERVLSIGNSINLNENDYLEYLIQDQETRVICLYLESIADGRQLMRLAAATDKPIVMLKSNTNPASNEIANFHTSALAGNDRVCDCALSQAGIHRVHSLGKMADLLKVFQLPLMVGNQSRIEETAEAVGIIDLDGIG